VLCCWHGAPTVWSTDFPPQRTTVRPLHCLVTLQSTARYDNAPPPVAFRISHYRVVSAIVMASHGAPWRSSAALDLLLIPKPRPLPVTPQAQVSFSYRLIRSDDRFKIHAMCDKCGKHKVVSMADGSLQEWEQKHISQHRPLVSKWVSAGRGIGFALTTIRPRVAVWSWAKRLHHHGP
jgi:hypothetical protein